MEPFNPQSGPCTTSHAYVVRVTAELEYGEGTRFTADLRVSRPGARSLFRFRFVVVLRRLASRFLASSRLLSGFCWPRTTIPVFPPRIARPELVVSFQYNTMSTDRDAALKSARSKVKRTRRGCPLTTRSLSSTEHVRERPRRLARPLQSLLRSLRLPPSRAELRTHTSAAARGPE